MHPATGLVGAYLLGLWEGLSGEDTESEARG